MPGAITSMANVVLQINKTGYQYPSLKFWFWMIINGSLEKSYQATRVKIRENGQKSQNTHQNQ